MIIFDCMALNHPFLNGKEIMLQQQTGHKGCGTIDSVMTACLEHHNNIVVVKKQHKVSDLHALTYWILLVRVCLYADINDAPHIGLFIFSTFSIRLYML